jgi:phospholipase C
MSDVVRAFTATKGYKRGALFVIYDEWGGFFDHVPPPKAPVPPADEAIKPGTTEDGLLGFRTPCFLISPYARRAQVSHTVFDHTSILKFIEWRWGLDPLTVRDATANNLADALQFVDPEFKPKQFNVPAGPFGRLCLPAAAAAREDDQEWLPLLQIAADFGWPVDVSLL